MDTGAQAADQHVRRGDAVFLHQRQRGVDAAAGGDAEGDTLAILSNHPGKVLHGLGVAHQVLIQIGKDGSVAVTGCPHRPLAGQGPMFVPARQLRQPGQVGVGMGLPGIMPPHPRDAMTSSPLPGLIVSQQFQQGTVDGGLVQRIHQHAILAVGDDIHRPAVLGGHHRQSAGGGLQDGQAEGFRQCRVDEHPT